MRVNTIEKQINFYQKSEKNYNTPLAICGGMILSPLIPIIDGDSFKSTFKNRNTAKYITGMAAIGGGIAGAYLLGEKYSDKVNESARKTATFAVAAPLILLVDDWASKGNKIAKKWYFISALAGGIIGYAMSKIKHKH